MLLILVAHCAGDDGPSGQCIASLELRVSITAEHATDDCSLFMTNGDAVARYDFPSSSKVCTTVAGPPIAGCNRGDGFLGLVTTNAEGRALRSFLNLQEAGDYAFSYSAKCAFVVVTDHETANVCLRPL